MQTAPQTAPVEYHFKANETIRDVVIGMADGLTVPFALAAGLSGAVAASHIIVTAGVAEVAAGSIAMGLGGYLAAKSDAEHYAHERLREETEVRDYPEKEREEVADVFRGYGMSEAQITPVVDALASKPEAWVDFMMRFELGLEEPEPKRALVSALTIAGSYIVGGMVPLAPYFFVPKVATALTISVAVTMIALFMFGYVKSRFTGTPAVRGGIETLLVGGLAAGAAFAIARLISPGN